MNTGESIPALSLLLIRAFCYRSLNCPNAGRKSRLRKVLKIREGQLDLLAILFSSEKDALVREDLAVCGNFLLKCAELVLFGSLEEELVQYAVKFSASYNDEAEEDQVEEGNLEQQEADIGVDKHNNDVY